MRAGLNIESANPQAEFKATLSDEVIAKPFIFSKERTYATPFVR